MQTFKFFNFIQRLKRNKLIHSFGIVTTVFLVQCPYVSTHINIIIAMIFLKITFLKFLQHNSSYNIVYI